MTLPGRPPRPGRTAHNRAQILYYLAENLSELREDTTGIARQLDSVVRRVDSQSEVLTQLARQLSTLNEVLKDWSHRLDGHATATKEVLTIARQQLDAIEALKSGLNDRLGEQAAVSQRIESGLAELPRMAAAQRESIANLETRWQEISSAQDGLAKALAQANGTQGRIEERLADAVRHLQRLGDDTTERGDKLLAAAATQARRLAVFGWSVLGLAAVATIVGLFALFR